MYGLYHDDWGWVKRSKQAKCGFSWTANAEKAARWNTAAEAEAENLWKKRGDVKPKLLSSIK